jgi:hypothetical protein
VSLCGKVRSITRASRSQQQEVRKDRSAAAGRVTAMRFRGTRPEPCHVSDIHQRSAAAT